MKLININRLRQEDVNDVLERVSAERDDIKELMFVYQTYDGEYHSGWSYMDDRFASVGALYCLLNDLSCHDEEE